ncbi:MAG TPA: chemotaxis protein CheW [Candidatus Hydrogenedentes bacterium]|nr:chemotaxis protein CheW [Candidatus Hydrogenedentota bacterium]HOL76282.1 chemotaxis protein CheW [Candidatus Hydrogenedentota bacterium]HPO86109.1 chemotaxis protein CheW [Candidatus Hydrogenedentota bacterium]
MNQPNTLSEKTLQTDVPTGPPTGALAEAGKYLTFRLGEETFGLPILKVQEIIGMMPVTAVPRVPSYVRGVINLRGKVIPVIDLRLKFGLEGKEDTTRTCIIVLQVAAGRGNVVMGTIVDEVSEVVNVAQNQIEPAPSFGASLDTEFILGMGKIGDKVVMLLDVDRVLSAGEIATLNRLETSV